MGDGSGAMLRYPPLWLRTASMQVLVVSAIFFCCPGVFNAFSSIASGLQDPTIAFRGNMFIYVFFTVSSIVAAALMASVGIRRAFVVGSLGYVLYAASLWNLSTKSEAPSTMTLGIFYVASAALGISAGFLWTAHGQVIMSYATEANQGQYLSRFWVIFNLGATGGGIMTCLLNWSSIDTATHQVSQASDTTFLAFVALTVTGLCIAATCIISTESVVKEDGTNVASTASSRDTQQWRIQAKRLLRYLDSSHEILLLFPFFMYSNWFYTYHSFFNVATFNLRTGGLASACYWTAQMVAAHWLGSFLDSNASAGLFAQRRVAWIVILGLAIVWNLMWAWGWYAQDQSLRLSYDTPLALDILSDTRAALAPLALYILYGAGDALGQVWIYWYLSSVCSNGKSLEVAGFNAGLYKSVQALSAAVSWYIGSQRVSPSSQLLVNWVLSNVALLGAMLSLRTRHNPSSNPLLQSYLR